MPHQYLPETLALIEQAEREIAAEQAATTDTSAVDNGQLAGIFAHLQANQKAAERPTPLDVIAGALHSDHTVDVEEIGSHDQVALAMTAMDELRKAGYQIVPAPREEAAQNDPQWAGPSLPHPTEATSEAEADELREGWDNWQHGIDPNQIHEGHYDEAIEA